MAEMLAFVSQWAEELGGAQFVVGEGQSVRAMLGDRHVRRMTDLPCAELCAEIDRLAPVVAHSRESGQVVVEQAGLRLLALSGGQILEGDHPVVGWETQVAREMLFLFATYGGSMRLDQAVDRLWPDHDKSKGSSQFHTTLHRLRSVLGSDAVSYIDGEYRLREGLVAYYDVDVFRSLTRPARLSDPKARERALDIYHTEFLESCEHGWCLNLRAFLEKTLRRVITIDAEYHVSCGELLKAEAMYERLITVDPTDELGHRGVMWCRANHDDLIGVNWQYHECERIIGHEIGEPLLEKTRRMYRMLANGELPSMPF